MASPGTRRRPRTHLRRRGRSSPARAARRRRTRSRAGGGSNPSAATPTLVHRLDSAYACAMTETAPEAHEGRRDLVVIGASAGGVETLKAVVGRLPADLPAAICIVMHLAPGSPSALAHILRRSGSLPCHAARDGQELKAGEILVAPPDRHLIVSDGVVNLTVAPRENNHRPAVDALFR